MKKKEQIEILEELIEGVETLGEFQDGWWEDFENGKRLLEHIKGLEE